MEHFKQFTNAICEDDIIKNFGTSHCSVVSELDAVDLIQKKLETSICSADSDLDHIDQIKKK